MDKKYGNITHICENEGVTYLTFEPLSALPGITHCFSTRLGGVSSGQYATMNFAFDLHDDPDKVRENYRRMAAAVGFSTEDMVLSDQTHTTNVLRDGPRERGAGYDYPLPWHDIDGFVTDEEDVVLFTTYADCVPLYFVDPVRRAIGLSHSGWRGTAAKMGLVTVRKLQEEFGSDPADIISVIGPSICQTCYEVSEECAVHFPKETLIDKHNGHYQLDLWEANRLVLLEAGLKEDHIYKPDLCTCCHPDLLFSHRATKGKRGNLGAFLGLTSLDKREREI